MFFYTILVTKKPWQHEPPKAFVTEPTFYLGNEKREDFFVRYHCTAEQRRPGLLRFGACSFFSNFFSSPTVILEFTGKL